MRRTFIAFLLTLSACSRRDDPAGEPAKDLRESPSEKQAAVQEAFASASAVASSADDKAELDVFFTKLGASYREADAATVVGQWDYAMTLDLSTQQGFPLPKGMATEKLAAAIRKSQMEQLPTTAKFSAWDQHEITKIVYLDEKDRDEVQVYLRQHSKVTGAGRTRWWLRKRGGSWGIYDVEELTAGLRLSTILGVGLAGARDDASWGPHGADLMGALQAAAEYRMDDVEASMKRVRKVTFPPALQTYVHYLDGMLHLNSGNFDAALAELDLALKLNPEFISVHLARMGAFNAKGDSKAALEAGAKYEAALGTDADLKHEYARARKGLNEIDEAERLLSSCLDEVADHTECLADLAGLLPAARHGELDARLTKMKDFDASLREALDLCLDKDGKAGARALFDAAKRVKPVSPVVTEYGTKVKAL
jgi:tetratricopeptide (TPR) repeat protein